MSRERLPRRHTRVVAAAVATPVLVGAGLGIAFTRDGSEAEASEDVTTATVTAERRTLLDSERVSGELGYDEELTVASSAAGGVLTGLPKEASVVRRGQAAYRVDDVPVLLLTGSLPLWRELAWGVDDGADVKQLEQNLEALGYDPGTVDETFTEWTHEAVQDLQEDKGLEETGKVSAEQFLVLPHGIRVGAPTASIGTQLQPGTQLYAATSTHRAVTVDLDPASESLAKVGAKATVTLPDGSTTKATITSVGTVATATGGDESEGEDPSAESTIPVTLELADSKAVQGLTAAPVTVDLTRDTRKDVVTVPVTALVALAEGGYGVQKVDGGLTAVEPGLYASGFVEIKSGLEAGDEVVVPQ
ncbi:peptidoglycan-binding protein [Nocardioides speluncae]|uniref:peptidoglycan-binding protein n=1 Tax=Nocardioides speluncae TaxID=2670337 RepID=UPI000D68DA1D|nr:peptidoglycan-binding protein [Nocardioides speluncae]